MLSIYVLKLEKGKYYIGKTTNPKFRLFDHFAATGSAWTTKYKPIEILKLIPNCDAYDEDKYTKQYMDNYGIDNVRGGSFVSVKLKAEEINVLEKMNKGTNDLCFKCGKPGHFAINCTNKLDDKAKPIDCWQCGYCNKVFDTKECATFHQIIHCKNARQQTSYEDDDEDDEDDDDDDEDDEDDEDEDFNTCFRCGRGGHFANSCYASRHVKGYKLY